MLLLNVRNSLRPSQPLQHVLTIIVLLASLFISRPAVSHPALTITDIETFEAQTDATNTQALASTMALIDALTLEQTPHTELAIQTSPDLEALTPTTAPITTETPEIVIAADLWDRIRTGFAMADIKHPSVKRFERRFAKNPALMREMMHNAQKYLFHVTEVIEQKNMPTELALLPLVESRYNPTARSGARAAGLWQIMPNTGKALGLNQNWWIDERYDICASTNAALDYLSGFYDRFEDWQLALAAYNAGAGTVSRAIKHNKAAHRPIDYLHLKLPKETKNYLPKLQAIKNIVSNPEQFGIDMLPINDAPYFTDVTVPKQIDKALIAALAETTESEFEALNPQFKRPLITDQTASNVQLPMAAAKRFEANLSVYDKPLVSWKMYTLPAGERLSRVAKSFQMPAKKLGKLNDISTHRRHRSPINILVPSKEAKTEETAIAQIYTDEMLRAQQQANNLSPTALKALNKNNHLLYKPYRKRQRTYVVKRGDTLSEIAQRYNLSWKKLQRLNHLKNRLLKAGQRIKLY